MDKPQLSVILKLCLFISDTTVRGSHKDMYNETTADAGSQPRVVTIQHDHQDTTYI